MFRKWRGEPGSPGLISRGVMLLLALYPPLALANWALVLVTGDTSLLPGASIALIAGILVAGTYPHWLPSVWRANNRYRIAGIRARQRTASTTPHLGLNAAPADLPKRW